MQSISNLVTPGAKRATRTAHCEIHGAFESVNWINNIWSKCPACASEAEAKAKAAEELKLREARKAEWERRVGSAGIPDRFQSRSLKSFAAETPEQQDALQFAVEYADNFDQVLKTGRSALFVGRPGTGKTHLAVGIALRIMHRDSRTALFTTVQRAIRRIKDTWARDSEQTETQVIQSLTFPDLLILDEVGVQFGSKFESDMLFDILNERYEKRRPTILLSNETDAKVREYLGPRVFDRLREDGGRLVPFEWDSHRGRIGAQA